MESSISSRRAFLGVACGATALMLVRPSIATPRAMKDAMAAVTGGVPAKLGRIKLDLPPLVENGNSVAMTIRVESPMTAQDYVKAIHVISEKNPQPNVISVTLGPRSGRAEVQTRIRLADSQQVVALCEMSDGSFWSDQADVILTISACLEDPV